MKNILIVMGLLLSFIGNSFAGDDDNLSPGEIRKGSSPYDGKRFAWMEPGSLFDKDNSPGLFRIGAVWDERHGEKLHIIVNFPVGKSLSPTELAKTTGVLKVKIADKDIELNRVVGSVLIKEEGGISREVKTYIRFDATREILKSILSSNKVSFRLDAANKVYEGNLDVPTGVKNYYKDVKYTAINGLKAFYEEAWGSK